VRAALIVLLAAAGCGHGETALREEQARARHYRDGYESQAQEIQQLKKRVAELESRGCR
jgi:hypothetical protein